VNQLNANPFEVDPSISTLLSESIEEVLGNLLGERAKQAIYVCLERQGLQRQQIPEHLSRFDAFLEDNFGKAGAVIERQIAKRFYTVLGLDLVEEPHHALTDYVDMASRRLSGGRGIDLITRLVAG
jgi:hypothetical protein